MNVSDALTVGASGSVSNEALDASSVTLQGNSFNGNDELVKLNGSGQLPAVDGSQLTNLTLTAGSVGSSQITDGSVGLGDLNLSGIDTHYVTTQTVQVINGTKTITADWVNITHPWSDDEVSDSLTIDSGGSVANAALDASSVTLQGNSFNGNDELVKLNSSGQLPAVDGSQLTNLTLTAGSVGSNQITDGSIVLGDLDLSDIDAHYVTTATVQVINGTKTITADWVNTAHPWSDNEVSDSLTVGESGSVANAALDASSVTLQGNSFNGNDELVKLNGSGQLPAVDGSQLTNLTLTAGSVGSSQITDGSVGLGDLNLSGIDTHYVTTQTVQVINGTKTITADWVNTTHPWSDNEVSDSLTIGSGGSVANAALDASSVTLQGNSFNGNNELVQLNGSGQLPAVDGSQLTNLTLTAGSVGGSQITDGSISLGDLNLSDIDGHYVTTGTAQMIEGVKTITADWVNTTHPWSDNEVSDSLTIDSGGSVANAALDASSVTLQGNSFNGNDELVKLNGSGQLPAVDGSQLTNLTLTAGSVGSSQITDGSIALSDIDESDFDTHYVTTGTAQTIEGIKTITADWVNTTYPWSDNEVSDALTVGASGSVANAALDASSVTLQGNSFNGNDELVKLNGSGQLPAVDGSQLTNLTLTAGSVGSSQITDGSIALSDIDESDFDTHYVTTGTAQTIEGVKTITADWVNTTYPWSDNEVSDSLTIDSGGSVANAALDASSVTLQGNSFNGNDELVKLNSSGQLPAVDGSQLTNLTLTAGSVGSSQITDGSIVLADIDTSDFDTHYVTTGTVQVINGTKTITADWVNTTHPWSDNEVSDSLTIDSGGSVSNEALDASSVTLQGNSFNGNNELVKLNGSGQLPAVDGSQLTNLTLTAGSVGSSQITDGSIVLADIDESDFDTHYVTTATVQVINGTKTITADWVNTTHPWSDSEVSDSLTIDSGGSVANAALDASSVTLQGNSFNGNDELVKLDGSGQLPVVDGSQLTNLTLTVGSVGSSQVTDGSIALGDLNLSDIDTHYVTTGTVQVIEGSKTFSSSVTINGILKVPTGASPSLSSVGEIAYDTTDNTLLIHDNSASRVIGHDIYQFNVTLEFDGDWDNEAIPVWSAPKDFAVTLIQVNATVFSGTGTSSLSYNIEERAFASLNSAGTDIYSSDQAADVNGEKETSFSNAGIASEAHLVFTTGSSAETDDVDSITLTFYYRKNVE